MTSIIKHSHHTLFDKAWYLQPTGPPAAQLLYDLGIEPNDAPLATGSINDVGTNVTHPPEMGKSNNMPTPKIDNITPGSSPAKKSIILPPLPTPQPPTLHQLTASVACTEANNHQ
jgi:hypothetical protein